MREDNYAFIDSQNLNLGVRSQGWSLDFGKFQCYLRDKFRVTKPYLFVGYIPSQQSLYNSLTVSGYQLIFKPVVRGSGKIKGNVDAELVLHTMHELCEDNFDKAVIVTGDGDFHCLVEYLVSRNRLKRLVVPNKFSYSSLLRKYDNHATFITPQQEQKLGKQKR